MSHSFTEAGLMVFDLDGTLVDSAPDITLAANRVLQRHGYPVLSQVAVEPLIGLPAMRIFEAASVSDPECLVGEFRAVLADVSGTYSHPYPGVESALTHLRQLEWSLAVATNKPSALAMIVLERAGLLPLFEVVVGAERLPPKPDPAVVTECMKLRPRAITWMVGDTTMDMEAGKAAGAQTVAIASGSHSEVSLATSHPTLLCPNFRAFAKILGVPA